MTEHCAACGYAAEKPWELPEQWRVYLRDELGTVETRMDGAAVWLCRGCGMRMNQLLDARYPEGGYEIDDAVREFLEEITTPPAESPTFEFD